MSENRPTSLKGWLKCQPCQLVIITMRYHSGRGGSLIKELDLKFQMESQVTWPPIRSDGNLAPLMMDVSGKHTPSEHTKFSYLGKRRREPSCLTLKLKLKPGGTRSFRSRDADFSGPGCSTVFFTQQVTPVGSQSRETLKKDPETIPTPLWKI